LAAVPAVGRATRVEGAAAPEADATRALYERYGNQIFGYCLHQLGSREEAEDAVQSTFLNAFRGLRRGVVPEAEQAWLFKIAQNVCLSRRRSTWRRGRVESPADFEVAEERAAAPHRRADELIGLQDVLENMPENQRRAILLREWQGLSYREIAEELELSQAAVETLIFRARRALASGLEASPAEQRSWRVRVRSSLDLGSVAAWLKSFLVSGVAVKAAGTAAVVTVASAVVAIPQEHTNPRAAAKPAPAPTRKAASAKAPVSLAPMHSQSTAPIVVPHVAPEATPAPAPVRHHATRPVQIAAPSHAPAPPAPAVVPPAPDQPAPAAASPTPAVTPAPAAVEAARSDVPRSGRHENTGGDARHEHSRAHGGAQAQGHRDAVGTPPPQQAQPGTEHHDRAQNAAEQPEHSRRHERSQGQTPQQSGAREQPPQSAPGPQPSGQGGQGQGHGAAGNGQGDHGQGHDRQAQVAGAVAANGNGNGNGNGRANAAGPEADATAGTPTTTAPDPTAAPADANTHVAGSAGGNPGSAGGNGHNH